MSTTNGLVGVVCALITSATALAEEKMPATRYLVPASYQPTLDAALSLHIEESKARVAASAWPADELRWLFVRAHGTQENRDTLPAAPRDATASEVRIERAGAAMIGVDFKPAMRTLESDALKRLARERISEATRTSAKPGDMPKQVRVRHIASAKTLVRADGEPTEPSEVATGKSGQKVEIRPFGDPTVLPAGGDLPLKVYFDGDKCPNARLFATHLPSNTTREVAADKSGFANLTLHEAGEWRLEVHHLTLREPAAAAENGASEAPQFDCTIWTATLTFEVPAKREGR